MTTTPVADPLLYTEQAVLGALLEQPATLEQLPWLTGTHFHTPRHQTIYTVLRDLIDQGGYARPADLLQEILRRGCAQTTGGAPYLHTLLEAASTIVPAMAPALAERMREAHTRRRVHDLGTKLQQLAGANDLDHALDLAANDVLALVDDTADQRPTYEQARTPLNLAQLFSTPPTPPRALAAPIAWAGKLTTLYGPGKAGKSLVAQELAAAIATGRPVLGNPAQDPATVVYIDQEMTPDDWRDRLTAMGYSDKDNLERLVVYNLAGWPPLDTPDGGRAVHDAAVAHRADLVIIDTVSKVLAGEENANDTHQAFYRHTLVPLKRTGAGALILDHTGKDIERGARGGSAKTDNVDLAFELLVRGKATLSLRATHTRFRLDADLIYLRRDEHPHLTHTVETVDEHSDAVVEACIRRLEALNPTEEMTRGQAAAVIRETGAKFRNDTISEAWRLLRERHGWER